MKLWLAIFLLSSGTCLAETNTPPAAPATTNAPPTIPATTNVEPTVVTSERLSVDYAHNAGVFEGNVLVVDPRITVRSDKMTVEFAAGPATVSSNSTTNVTARTVRKLVAEGGVIIVQGNKKSSSDKAVYTAEDGKVVLTGHPQVESPDGTVNGERITFWRDQSKMLVESSTRLVIFPEDMKKKDEEKKEPPKDEKKPEETKP